MQQLSESNLRLLLAIDRDINVAIEKLTVGLASKELESVIQQYNDNSTKLETALKNLDKPSTKEYTTGKYENKLEFCNKRYTITQRDVRKLLYYDPQTGNLYWKISQTFGKRKEGDLAGRVLHHGYLAITINSKVYTAHRIIWLYVYGYFPEHQIDHINRKRDDNRLCNLREVTARCNIRNSSLSSLNKTGVKGISWKASKKTWQCTIRVNETKVITKTCQDFTEAVCYRLAFEQCLDWNLCDSESTSYKYLVEIGVINPTQPLAQPKILTSN